ncbi:IclR family transcriptional regulator [Paenibacillus eucommiae]|uniref:DNA-binding IclR family transcriptional regulator n=1 Tax=Paenibacillus eucommiae TaxID=1355755 RepID=A0ABS4IRF5_9BACL|nr:IclR family transcriptional regulator [Paenibacillus eucommiae]MBP1990154.1 DNA-binding IclR family transcriptional regulator [Paenibacillus eucommiae]
MEKQIKKVKSADRVLDIFELFANGADSYNLTEISKKLNMPPSSTYNILQNMLSRGYLEADKSGKQFRIGYKLFAIRNRYIQGTSLSEEFNQFAEKIVNDLNESVSLSILRENKLYYIRDKVSTHGLRYTPNQGDPISLHATAAGKILLTQFTMEELRALYPTNELEQITDKTINHFDELVIVLDKVRSTGIGYNLGETVSGVHCVAGGILDQNNKIIAAISMSIPTVRITDEVWERIHYWINLATTALSKKFISI